MKPRRKRRIVPDENERPVKKVKTKVAKASDVVSLLDAKEKEFTSLKSEIEETALLIKANNLTVGAHVSVAKGIWNSLVNSYKLKATAMAFFLTQPRKWTTEKVFTEEEVNVFKKGLSVFGYDQKYILPHGNYLVNLGSPDKDLYEKSFNLFLIECKLCEQLGISMLNIHPGSATNGMDREDCLAQIAASINEVHQNTSFVTIVLENMCRQGNTVGGDLKELRSIIDAVKDKSRVGICLDTCHAMSAGYDISTEKGIAEMFDEIESTIGLEYLKAFHLNDKKGKCGDKLDRHESLGKGCIKFPVMQYIATKFPNLPMVLETPNEELWEGEIKKLRSFKDKGLE